MLALLWIKVRLCLTVDGCRRRLPGKQSEQQLAAFQWAEELNRHSLEKIKCIRIRRRLIIQMMIYENTF
jgi:hypothetical protein